MRGGGEQRGGKFGGAMTRIELCQWMTRYALDSAIRLAVGTDGNFSEFHTIQYDLSLDAPNLEIKKSLLETCQEAIHVAKH